MERGKRSKIKPYDDTNLHWYQRLYLSVYCYKLNKRYKAFSKAYNLIEKDE